MQETDKGSYIFVVSEEPGRPAAEVLPGLLSELVASLRFKKSMRWGSGEERFSRPVRWLVALLDGAVVDFGHAWADLVERDLGAPLSLRWSDRDTGAARVRAPAARGVRNGGPPLQARQDRGLGGGSLPAGR